MTAVNGSWQVNGQAGSAMVGLTYLFAGMSKDFRDGVVKRALTGQLQVSGETRAALRRAVGSCVSLNGFRSAELAPPPLLQEPVSQATGQRDDLAGAVLKVWVESQQQLRERVDAYLRERGLVNGEPDYSGYRIAVMHPDERWNDAMDGLAEENPSISRDDLTLMSSYISGWIAQGDGEEQDSAPEEEGESPSPVSAELAGVFGRVLDVLERLSPDAPEWEQGVAEFVAAIAEIRERKQGDAKAVAELDAEVMALAERHTELLGFFEWNVEEKLKERAYPWADMDAVRAMMGRLGALLDEYAPVHPMAAVRSEEAQRGPRRVELQQRIDEALVQFGALEVQTPPPLPVVEVSEEAAPVVEAAEPLITEEELASLRAENERLAEANRGLESDNEALRQEAGRLSSDLGESRNSAENWRLSYQELRRSQALVPVEPLPEIESVGQAVSLAEKRLGDRLSFQLINKSDTGIPFDKPRQVWDALEWLATVYYEAKTGGSGETDLDLSLRQMCGWHYTANQSMVTIGQYREYYEIWLRGRKRELTEHIGTGNGYPRGTIRIAFVWDAEEKKLVVGYIGRHQRTDAS